MHMVGADQVIVVEDQQCLIVTGIAGQLVDQDCHQPLERGRSRRPEQWRNPRRDPGPRPVQRGHNMAPEPRRIAIGGVQ